ncbi:recombinase family protein [Streptomyces sp. NPDC001750]|uniref:recombinase family protein n=1 Tax=unclassified Streptomyces TaxID=2593676 RepID=UPI0036C962D5
MRRHRRIRALPARRTIQRDRIVPELRRIRRLPSHQDTLPRINKIHCQSVHTAGGTSQGIDTSTAVGRMFFQILGAIAEFEHALMSEGTMDGLEAARARGRTGGQKPKLGPRQVQLAREMYDSGELTVQQIADEFGVTRPTFYRHLSKVASQSQEPA